MGTNEVGFWEEVKGKTLGGLPMGRDHKRVLNAIIEMHHAWPADQVDEASADEARARAGFLFTFYRELRRDTKFKRADPRDLKGRHVVAMLDLWESRGTEPEAVLANLGFLRTFAEWTRKHALIPADDVLRGCRGVAP